MRGGAIILCALIGCPAAGLAERSDTERAGDVLAVALPLAALGMTFYDKDPAGRLQFAKSMGVSALATLALKEAVDKKRPDGDCCDAFPSGHTSTAFVSAAFMHRRYGFTRAIPAYLLATYVGYTRVDADRHATEDVLAGAVVGILSSWFLTTRYSNAQIAPVVRRGYYGLRVSGRF